MFKWLKSLGALHEKLDKITENVNSYDTPLKRANEDMHMRLIKLEENMLAKFGDVERWIARISAPNTAITTHEISNKLSQILEEIEHLKPTFGDAKKLYMMAAQAEHIMDKPKEYESKDITEELGGYHGRKIEDYISEIKPKKGKDTNSLKERILGMRIEEFLNRLMIKLRVCNTLIASIERTGWKTTRDLLDTSATYNGGSGSNSLLALPNFGRVSLDNLCEVIYGRDTKGDRAIIWDSKGYQHPDYDWKALADKLGVK